MGAASLLPSAAAVPYRIQHEEDLHYLLSLVGDRNPAALDTPVEREINDIIAALIESGVTEAHLKNIQ